MNDKLSQEDIDRLLKSDTEPSSEGALLYLEPEESDALGELGNIFMGAASTTLSLLLNNKVEITTPNVKEYEKLENIFENRKDLVIVQIHYKQGFEGSTIFALNPKDVVVIADLMMGGSGKPESQEIGDLQLSAVGEAMNQMIGSASTTMSQMLNIDIDITPPDVNYIKARNDLDIRYFDNDSIVTVVFQLKIGDLVNSEIMQFLSLSSAKDQIVRLMNALYQENTPSQSQSIPSPSNVQSNINIASDPLPTSLSEVNQGPVTVQPVQFSSFDDVQGVYGGENKNLDLLMDIKLRLTVELGRTELPIKKVLELTRGSVVELDKIAGEPVELFANGKLIAKGEVVVIEDNFGLRITNIVSPDDRLKNL